MTEPYPTYPQGPGNSEPGSDAYPAYPQEPGSNGPGGYGSGDPGHGSAGHGSAGRGSGQTPVPVDPPPAVRRLATLMLVRAALGVIGLVVSIATISSLRTRIEDRQTTLSHSAVDAVVTTSIVFSVVFGVAFTVLYVLLSRKVLQGRNWARIVTLVLAILGVLSLLGSAVQDQLAASRVLGVLAGLCDVAILVLVVSRASRSFFQSQRPS